MDDILLRRLNSSLVTGTPAVGPGSAKPGEKPVGESFDRVLATEISQRQLSFSKHAAQRIEQRGLDISGEELSRLENGMEMAREKGLDDALILMEGKAFIVSAKNSTIITAMGGSDLTNTVITNISGTVIL